MDIASKSYWNNLWKNNTVPKLFDINSTSLDDYPYIKFHDIFTKLFKKYKGKKDIKILERGCANSIWPIYFHKYWNFDVYGIDYSEYGCILERKIFKHYGISEENIYCANLFEPPECLIGKFDIVMSFGVAEHFDDTTNVIKVMSQYLKHNGLLFTEIPNLSGINGIIMKIFNKAIYDIHVPLDRKLLLEANQNANLVIRSCNYFLIYYYGIINIENLKNTVYYKFLIMVGRQITKFARFNENKMRPNKITSPYIYCLSQKSNDTKVNTGKVENG